MLCLYVGSDFQSELSVTTFSFVSYTEFSNTITKDMSANRCSGFPLFSVPDNERKLIGDNPVEILVISKHKNLIRYLYFCHLQLSRA